MSGKVVAATRRRENATCSRCQKLETENALLKKELNEQRANYTQLVREAKGENYSRRRVDLLKAQIQHLERQVNLLSESVHNYSELRLQLTSVKESCLRKINSIVEQIGGDSNCNGEKLVRQLEMIRGDISSLKERNKVTGIPHTDAYTGRYGSEEPHNIIDTVMERRRGITNISWLEGKVDALYCSLVRLEGSLKVIPSLTTPTIASLDPLYSNSAKLHSLVDHTLSLSCDVSQELLTLSLLVPGQSPPKHVNKKGAWLDSKQVLKELLPLLRNKQRGSELLHVLLSTVNTAHGRLTHKVDILEDNLTEHKALYGKHLQYWEALMDEIRSGHKQFVESVNELLRAPLKIVVDSFDRFLAEGCTDDLIGCLHGNIATFREILPKLELLSTAKHF